MYTSEISFNVTALVSMSNNESAASVEVWLFKQGLSDRGLEELSNDGCNTTSVVLQLRPTISDEVAMPSLSSVTLTLDDLKKASWIRFGNLTDLYAKWITDQIGGIQRLAISTPEGCSSSRFGFVAGSDDESEREPILVVFINDDHPAEVFDRIVHGGDFGPQENSAIAPNFRVKRQPEAGQLSACHLVPSRVK